TASPGRGAARQGRGLDGLPGVGGQRWDHWPASQRHLGRLGPPAREARATGPERYLHAAPHRPGRQGGEMEMRVGIVGCGLIGLKRARALGSARLVAAADTNPARAGQLATQFPGCEASQDWQAVVARPDVDVVLVATTNNSLAAVTLAAVQHGKHVLVEKPAARNAT